MKIHIAADLEGATSVFRFKQTQDHDTPGYREAVALLMGDIAAVAEGLREAGVDEIYAMDGHGGGNNFQPQHMVRGVRPGRRRTTAQVRALQDQTARYGAHALSGRGFPGEPLLLRAGNRSEQPPGYHCANRTMNQVSSRISSEARC